MPKYAVTKAMKVLRETTNNNSESQLVWWRSGHDCIVTSQGNPSVPLLSGSTMWPVDGNMVQLQAALAFWWILPMNLPATISSVHSSSSCTEPQECCCERSEQRQTCVSYNTKERFFCNLSWKIVLLASKQHQIVTKNSIITSLMSKF